MSTDDDTGDDSTREHPQVGSLGEEALRLLGSFAGWAGQHGAEVHHGVEDAARQALEGVQALTDGFDEHFATGAPECTWCPLCRTAHAVRELSPEVRTHLVSAASSLVKASSALLATIVPDQGTSSSHPTPKSRPDKASQQQPRIQHIDIDDPDPAT